MRHQLFTLETPVELRFTALPDDTARFSVLDDVKKFQEYSKSLLPNANRVDTLIERTLGHYLLNLPGAGDGRRLFQLRKEVEKENSKNLAKAWAEQYSQFQTITGSTRGWVRFSRACWNAIVRPDLSTEEIAKKWEVSAFEVSQMVSWYNKRGKSLYGEVPTIISPEGYFWYGDICDEEARFNELHIELRNHASKKLASPSFSYLSDIYESRTELIYRLLDRAWHAILYTAHKPAVESLKLAKSYMNTGIHHLAAEITESNGKQVFNEQTGVYEIMELGLIDNPEMDESKHEFLKCEDEEFCNVEIKHTLETMLNPREHELVMVLGGFVINEQFEQFANSRPDRRVAAFEYFKVQEQDLKSFLPGLLTRSH